MTSAPLPVRLLCVYDPMIDPSSQLVISPDLAMCELDGGSALIDLSTGTYFKLNGTASTFCTLIDVPKTFASVLHEMTEVYEVDAHVIEPELIALAEEMQAQGLLLVK